ncbi:MAG: hypothetical protein NPIRA03_40740 [Nitrospirales bacterium]|nr:MAG: hypothetical protein NPIRA03_40740 [Nitrospirales bacterium]
MKSPCGKFKGSRLEFLPRWLVGGIIIGVISLATGESQASFTLPMWSDTLGWDDASCYSTIQMADLDGDGQAELLGRCTSGIEAYSFNTKTGVWSPLPPGPGWTDAGGWDQAKYYLTIQTGDLDGDGKAELLARSAEHMVAYSYSAPAGQPTQGTWHELPPGPDWSDKGGWDHAEYYATIQTGDLDGDGKAELLARGAGGIAAYSYRGEAWHELPPGPGWTDAGGWDQAKYYLTIQTGDLDGDGKAELLARGAGGIEAYSFNTKTGVWSPLPPGPGWSDKGGWDQAKYYLTIQTGDLDGDGKAELLARGAGGIAAYSYRGEAWHELPPGPGWSDKGGWDHAEYYATIQTGNEIGKDRAVLIGRGARGVDTYEYAADKWASTVAPFPQFTGEELTAYNAINTGLALEPGVTVRSLYTLKSGVDILSYRGTLTSMKRPPKVSKKAWTTVKTQIEQELTWASFVASAFNNNSQLLTDVFLSQDLTLKYVAGLLKIEEDSSDKVTAGFSAVLSGVVDAIGVGVDKTAVEVVTTLVASAIDAGSELGMDDGSVTEEYVTLVGKIESNFQYAINGNSDNRTTIATDYGLLATVGQLLHSGTWNYPSPGQSGYQQASASARKEYARFLWKTLTPAVWYTFDSESGGKYYYPFPSNTCYHGISDGSTSTTMVKSKSLETLFNNTSTQCQTTFGTSCTLGLSLGEVYNDWGFRPVICAPYCPC